MEMLIKFFYEEWTVGQKRLGTSDLKLQKSNERTRFIIEQTFKGLSVVV